MSLVGFLLKLSFGLYFGWLAQRMVRTGYSPGMSNPNRAEQPGVFWFVFALIMAVAVGTIWEAFERFLSN